MPLPTRIPSKRSSVRTLFKLVLLAFRAAQVLGHVDLARLVLAFADDFNDDVAAWAGTFHIYTYEEREAEITRIGQAHRSSPAFTSVSYGMTSVEYVATAWPIEPGSIEMLTLSLRYNKGGFDYHYVFDFMDRTVECPRVDSAAKR